MRAVIYSRVSTPQQSLERQTADLKHYAEINEFEVVKVFEEKASGMNNKRPQFLELCKLTKNEVDIILIWKFSRLSRKAVFLQETIEAFSNKGINIHAFREDMHTLTEDGKIEETTQMCISFLATMVQQEAEYKKARMRSGWEYNVIYRGDRSYLNQTFGYIYDKEKKKLCINKSEAKIIRSIFRLSALGTALTRICCIMNEMGCKPKRSSLWSIRTIKHMLSNKVYTGEWSYKGHVLKAPQIVSRKLFDLSSVNLSNRLHKSQGHKHILFLRQKIRCPYCGKVYKSQKDFFYVCSSNISETSYLGRNCHGYSINRTYLDHIIWLIVLSEIEEIPIDSRYNPYKEEQSLITEKVNMLTFEISQLKTKQRQLLNTLTTTNYNKPEIYENIEVLHKRINNTRNELEDLNECNEKYKKLISEIYSINRLCSSMYPERFQIVQDLIEIVYPYKYERNCILSVKLKSGRKYCILYLRSGYYMHYSFFRDDILNFNVSQGDSTTNYGLKYDFNIISTGKGIFSEDELGHYNAEDLFYLIENKGLITKLAEN